MPTNNAAWPNSLSFGGAQNAASVFAWQAGAAWLACREGSVGVIWLLIP